MSQVINENHIRTSSSRARRDRRCRGKWRLRYRDEAVGVGGDEASVVEVGIVENSGELDSAGLDGFKRQDVWFIERAWRLLRGSAADVVMPHSLWRRVVGYRNT